MKKNIKKIFIMMILTFLVGCTNSEGSKKTEKKEIVVNNTKLLDIFKESYENKIMATYEMDLNDDGIDDLIVVYKVNSDSNLVSAVFENGEITKGIPAPIENIEIESNNFDDKPPLEFVLSGSKGTHFGYGIIRYENNELVNVFGSNMEDCC